MNRPYSKGDRRQDQRRGGGNFNNGNRGGSRGDRSVGERGFTKGFAQGGGNRGRNEFNRDGAKNQNSTASVDLMKTLLKLVVDKSLTQIFDKEKGMLILSHMKEAEDLAAVSKSVDFNSVSFCKALCEVLREAFENNIRIIQLDDNSINKFSVVLEALIGAGLHEGITAISAQNNRIGDIQFIHCLKKFTNLNELLLLGNSITREKAYADLSRNLPGLALLDGNSIARNLLALQNPLWVSLTPEGEGIIQILKTNLFEFIMSKNFDAVLNLFSSQAAFSCSSLNQNGFFLNQIPTKSKLNTSELPTELLRAMKGDFSQLNQKIRWRNLLKDRESFRNVARGKAEVNVKIKDFCGAHLPFSVQFKIASSNVEFLSNVSEPWMKVPVAIVTIHGTMCYFWNPQKNFEHLSSCPFVSYFFDRTLSMTLSPDQVSWNVCNDMIHIRPDHVVAYDDNRPADAVFYGFTPERLERLRRRLFPEVNIGMMEAFVQELVNHGIPSSDYNLEQLIAQIKASPPEQMSLAFRSQEGLSAFVSNLIAPQPQSQAA